MYHGRRIFDVHTHIGKFGKWFLKGREIEPFKNREIDSVESLRTFMKEKGIDYIIVMPHYTPDQKKPFVEYNPLVIECISKIENAYGGLWISPREDVWHLSEKILDGELPPKIKVLKISPDSWPKGVSMNPDSWNETFRKNFEEIMNFARKRNLIIHSHTGSGNSDIMDYVPFVETYGKKVKLHFVHMGGSAGGHFAFIPRFIEWLKDGYDFYCDTSFCRGFAPYLLVRKLLEEYPKGLSRIMFASDNPWGLWESEFWRVEGMPVEDDIKEKIFYHNAAEVYLGERK